MEKKNEINGDLKSLILIMSAGAGGRDEGNANPLRTALVVGKLETHTALIGQATSDYCSLQLTSALQVSS